MYLYVFPEMLETPTIKSLIAFREAPNPVDYFAVFPAVLEYTVTKSVTTWSIREYILSQMLEHSRQGAFLQRGEIREHLASDCEQLYALAFATDWDGLCREIGLLPFPSRGELSAETKGIPTDCSRRIRELCEAKDGQQLQDFVTAFFGLYADVNEAKYIAFRWESGHLQGIENIDPVTFADLGGLETQKKALLDNTSSFLDGRPSNNVLLVGGSGTGKSSCVKANLNYFAEQGLNMVEITKQNLTELPALLEHLQSKKKHYIIYIDDLSFDENDSSYIELKVVLDGRLEPNPANVLIYATSNRRRLLRETWNDRQGADDIHSHDTLHEKMSLSERFGIRLYFGVLSQSEYFTIITMILKNEGIAFTDKIGVEAATWASTNNGRSGRTAQQFANYYLARL